MTMIYHHLGYVAWGKEELITHFTMNFMMGFIFWQHHEH